MNFNSLEEALLVTGDTVGEPHARDEAWGFILNLDPEDFVEQLIIEL